MTARKFKAEPAVRGNVPLLVGLIAPSGAGKTYSALRLATGIQRAAPGDIYVIDTENGRAKHYADTFKFIHVPFEPPFGSLDYLEAIRFCASRNPAVVIVDSMSHEHVGDGGYLDTAEQVVSRIAGDDYAKREKAKFVGWAKAGPLRTKMIEGIKQIGGNFIFCWRAKEKTKPVLVDGKMKPVEMGLMPIGGEEWIYEMTMNCLIPARGDGAPTWNMEHVGERLMMKLPEQFKRLMSQPGSLSEDIGEHLARWAKGSPQTRPDGKMADPLNSSAADVAAPATTNQPQPAGAATQLSIEDMGREAAMRGRQLFEAFYDAQPREAKARLRAIKTEIEKLYPAEQTLGLD